MNTFVLVDPGDGARRPRCELGQGTEEEMRKLAAASLRGDIESLVLCEVVPRVAFTVTLSEKAL